jgi:putative flippase GtrA
MLKRLLSHRLVRFGAVGGIVTVCFMGFNALLGRGLGLAPSVAFLVAYPPALFLHFTLNKLWTFGDARSTSSRHLAEYFYSVVVTFLIQWPSFLLLQSVLKLPGWAAAGGANIVQMSASYALLRLRVFNGSAPAEENARLSWHRLIILVFAIAISAVLAGTGLGYWGLPPAATGSLPGLLSPLPYLIAGNLCASWLWLVFLAEWFPGAGLAVKLLGIAILGFCGGLAVPARSTVVAGGSVSAWYFLVTFMLAACYAALGWKRSRGRRRPPAVKPA